MRSYQRPKERHIYVNREDVKIKCPECFSYNVKTYPVVSEGGWWTVTKCQDCLHSLERKKLDQLLGPIFTISEFMK